jgi:alcohol dehydrogenase
VHRSTRDLPPLIAVNTTAGTGSEVTGVAVITDTQRQTKMTLIDWRITPRVSVNDPELMASMPASLTAATGFDALSHAVESYVSNASSPISEALAHQSIKLVFRWLPLAVSDGGNMEARDGMCHAAFLAGLAFNNSALGLVHALSHPVSARYHLPHGVVNAALLSVVERYNLPVAVDRFASMARAMGVALTWHSAGENAEKALGAMETLRRQLKLSSGLAALGVKEEDLPQLAAEAAEERVAAGNPRTFNREVLVQLYRDAL